MKEIWKTIIGYSDYKISNYGNIKSNERIIKSGRGYGLHKIELKILKLIKNPDGYLVVNLYNNSLIKQFKVHRLVAHAFLSNIHNKPEVNHKDGNKQNNNVNNLEWNTYSENRKHAYKMGLHSQKGERNNASKITNNEVFSIFGLYYDGMDQKSIAQIFNISCSNISLIINGKRRNRFNHGT